MDMLMGDASEKSTCFWIICITMLHGSGVWAPLGVLDKRKWQFCNDLHLYTHTVRIMTTFKW